MIVLLCDALLRLDPMTKLLITVALSEDDAERAAYICEFALYPLCLEYEARIRKFCHEARDLLIIFFLYFMIWLMRLYLQIQLSLCHVNETIKKTICKYWIIK